MEEKNIYWERITEIAGKQREKGVKKYGGGLEKNDKLATTGVVEYAQEELVDCLMYLEHLKSQLVMGINDYQISAMRTANGLDDDSLILNAALGLTGEAGEFADMVKKWKFQGHELDKEKAAKELGDICWYVAIAAKGLGYPLDRIMKENVEKLKKRYPDGFEADRSINRAE